MYIKKIDNKSDKNSRPWKNSKNNKPNSKKKADLNVKKNVESYNGCSDFQPKIEKISTEFNCKICGTLCEDPVTTPCCLKNFCNKCFLQAKYDYGCCPNCYIEIYYDAMPNDNVRKIIAQKNA